MGEVLVGDGADRQPGEIHLAGAAEVEQQVQRPLEGLDANVSPGAATSVMAPAGSRPAPRPSSRARYLGAPRALVQDLEHLLGPVAQPWRRSRGWPPAGQHVLEQHALAVEAADGRRCGSPARTARAGLRGEDAVEIEDRADVGIAGSVRRFRAGSVTMGLTSA
jgi:hypothetical protein